MDDKNLDLILDINAKADMQTLNKEIKKMRADIDKNINEIEKRKIKLGEVDDAALKQVLEKQIKALEASTDKMNLALEKKVNSLNKKYSSQMQKQVKQQQQADNAQVKSAEQAAKKKVKAEDNYAKEAIKIKKQLLKENEELEKIASDPYATAEQKKNAKKTIKQNNKDIYYANQDIKVFGTKEIQAENAQLERNIALKKERNQVEAQRVAALQKEAQANAATKEQEGNDRNNYNLALSRLKEMLQIEKQITALENNKKLSPAQQQELTLLQKQKQELIEQYQQYKGNINAASQLKQQLAEIEGKIQRNVDRQKAHAQTLDETREKAKGLGELFENIFKYNMLQKGIAAVSQGVRESIQLVRDLDKAFTDIRLVTQSTEEETQELQVSYNKLAKELSSTTQEVAEGATEWLRQGYSLEETNEMLRATMVLSKVGAIESSEATQLLTSSLNGFKIEAKDAMSIVDKVSAVDLKAATNSEELMTALSRTASSADMAGMSLDKLLGMIGTVSSVTRKSASTIGESFKTIFARMQNVKAGKDVDDEGESVNDVEKVLKKMNVTLRTTTGEFRDLESVFDELNEKWNTFNQVEQAQIATAIAGTRQRDNFIAMMTNYKEVLDLTTVSAESLGSAEEKMAIWQEGLEAKTNELKSAWEEFIISLKQSDSLKGLMDIGIWALNNLPTIIGYVTALFTAFKGGSIITTVSNAFEGLGRAFKLINLKAIRAGGGLSGLGSALKSVISPANALAFGIGATIGVITAAVSAYKAYKQAQLDAVSATNKAIESLQKEQTNIDDTKKKYTDIINSSASLEDKKRQLQSVQAELNNSFDTKKTKIDLVNGSYKEQIQLLNQLEKENLDKQVNEYNQGADNRKKLLDDNTQQLIRDFNKNSDAGKLLEETVKKYAGNNPLSFNVSPQYNGLFSKATEQATINTSAENLVKIYNELQEKSKDLSKTAQEELGRYINASTWVQKSMKEDYEKYQETFNTEQQANIANFQKNNWTEYSNYKSHLLAMQNLQEQYSNATTKSQKEDLAKQINELDKSIKEAKNKLYNLTDDENVKNGLDSIFNSLSQYSTPNIDFKSLNIDGVDDKFLEKVKKEMKDTGKVSETTTKQIGTLIEKLNGDDVDTTWANTFKTQLDDIGISVEKATLSKENLKTAFDNVEKAGKSKYAGGDREEYEGSLEDAREYKGSLEHAREEYEERLARLKSAGRETKYLEEELQKAQAEITKQQNIILGHFSGFFSNLDDQLNKLGINSGDATITSLKNSLANGSTKIGEFYTRLSEYLKKFGIDIENLTKDTQNNINSLDFNFKESVGTDEDFEGLVDNIDKLYKMKSTLSKGDFLDYEDFRFLTDNFESAADIIDKTGDVTKLTANDIQKIIDETTKQTEEDLNKKEELFEDTINNIDTIVKNANFGDGFANTMKDAYDQALESLKKGEKLSFLDPDIVGDKSALTDYANEINGITTALNDMSISAEDAQTKLYMVSLEAMDGATQADAFGIMVDLLGTDFFNLDTDVQNALIDLGLYNQETKMADSTQMVATLTNIANNFDNADTKTQEAYTSLISYIAAIGQAEDASPKSGALASIVASGLVKIKAAARVGAREIIVREAGLKNSNNAGKKKSSGSSKKSDAEKLQEKVDDFREDEGTKLNDVTEELINQYKAEERKLKLAKKNLDYANDLFDVEENTTKWLKVQNQLLTNQRKQIQSIYRENSKIDQQLQKIQSENKKYDINSWFDSDGNATLAYANLINSFAEEEKNYRATVKINSETDLENAKKHIEKIKEQKEYVENLFNSAKQLKETWKDNNEEIQNLITTINDGLKTVRDTLKDGFLDALQNETDKANQIHENNISRLESLITMEEKNNEILNNALDTKADLEKELRANKNSYQYLDDYMRSIIFNEDDYNKLSGALDNIMSEVDTLTNEYYEKINNLTDDEMYKIDEITNEYERQVELKEKEYELLKAELEVTKAKTKLENVKNERTVRMFVGGQWQWVADPNAIRDAEIELSDAEKEKDRIEREKEQQESINQKEQQKDKEQTEINYNNQLMEKIEETIDMFYKEYKTSQDWLKAILKENLPGLNDLFADEGLYGKLNELLGNIGGDTDTLEKNHEQSKQYTTEEIKEGLKSGKLDPEKWAEKIGWVKGDNGKWYAPKDDPDYDPAGFDFGKVNPETQTTTDKDSGVQIQGNDKIASNTNTNTNTQTSKFPKEGKLKGVYSSLRIRSGAGLSYKVIGSIPPKGKPQILGENGGWAQVKYNGITGWSSKQYLTYDKGGLMSGKGIALKDVITPEAVLSPEQTKAWVKLVDNLTSPMLAHLTKTPQLDNKKDNSTETFVGDTYTFNNVTVKANDIQEFIASIKGQVPTRNN